MQSLLCRSVGWMDGRTTTKHAEVWEGWFGKCVHGHSFLITYSMHVMQGVIDECVHGTFRLQCAVFY